MLSYSGRSYCLEEVLLAVVVHHPAVEREREALPPKERVALDHALDKLAALGEHLRFPHQSAIRDSEGIRELRPRGGRSPWRGFYARVGEEDFVLLSVGPEAEVDQKGFRRAVAAAEERLGEIRE